MFEMSVVKSVNAMIISISLTGVFVADEPLYPVIETVLVSWLGVPARLLKVTALRAVW